MFGWFTGVRLESGPFPVVLFAFAAVVLAVLATRRPLRRWLVVQLIGAVIGLGFGYLLAYFVSDVWDTFGVALSSGTRFWFGMGFAGIGFAIAGLWRARAWRLSIAIGAVFLFALAGSVGVNADVAEFPTVGSALGLDHIQKLTLPKVSPSPSTTAVESLAVTWRAPANLPAVGNLGTVIIPATASHFRARAALVYLPPAALVKDAPRLPVLEMLSGQPGAPSDLITAGAMKTTLDQFAATHHGLAPIVVIPDQLGAPQLNPMCLDSPLGNAATYLTIDVPDWINSHLHVLSDRTDWAIGGFSEGGTCSIQLGAKYSGLYGSIFDISGQLAEQHGTIPLTIAEAFHGSAAAYTAATPLPLLAAGAPYRDTLGLFFVGQNDARFGAASVTISNAARAAGMTVHYQQSPGTAHDWHTVQYAIRQGIPLLAARFGLTQ